MPKIERTLSKTEYQRLYYEKFRDRQKANTIKAYYERQQPKPDKNLEYQRIIQLFRQLT
jgi:hypothetical protein